MPIINSIAAMHEELTAWRRDIHAHPELGFEEQRTSDIVAEKLTAFGCEVHRGIGGTGLVGVLKLGNSSRSIGLRADMDALPIHEGNTFDHRSVHDGKMHACGHDGHTTMLLGAARHLAETGNFDGQINFIFQPAEEGLGGALAMINDGLFERFPCDAIFGMHNRPSLALGKFAVRSGPMMAGGIMFDIDITGKGSHGGRPEASIDPVVVAAHITTALQTIISRNTRPVDAAVLSVTQIHTGDAYNVIPQTARLSGTGRAFTQEVLTQLEDGMRRLSVSIAEGFGARAEVDVRQVFAPTINNEAEAEFAAGICAEIVGVDNVDRSPPLLTSSEDFSFMLEKVPGCYFNIGNAHSENTVEVHNPAYDFNDAAIPAGTSVFVRLAETRLAR